ncbi:MAG TPA: hypothetical protein VGR73_01075 [Bryobacteraceae bacterium]|nr:hypothetical protein [Bryobacteraceae bacterium]
MQETNSVMELPATGSGQSEIFQLCVPIGRPSTRNLFYSLCVHAAVVTAMFTITLPATGPASKPVERLSPTELRLDGHLYYVSKIPAAEPEKRDSLRLTLPRAAAAGKAPAPAPPRQASPKQLPALPAPPQLTITAQVPATPSAAAQIAATRQQTQRMLARTFIPPEVKRNPAATQTLIQPLSPPDLVPPPTPLPSFRISSPQFPRIPRQFVAPGRRTPTPPAQVQNVPVPNVELVHADPVPTELQPKLALPRTPPPPEPPPVKAQGPTPSPEGDAPNVLSLSDRPAPLDKTIVVPPGNIAQESGDAAAAQAGAATAASTGPSTAAAAGPSNSAVAGPKAGSPAGTAAGTGTSAAGTTAGAGAGRGTSTGAGSNAAGTNAGAGGSGTAVAGTGRGSVGSGIGAALAGASSTGSTTAIVGSTNPGAGAGAGAGIGTGTGGTGAGGAAAGQSINNPPGGSYDAVVIQASPVDQYPETRGLLSGRPVYSVYISAGATRDWTLYFCIPNEKPPSTNTQMVQLDPAPAPIRAPYPYKLTRPAVALPSWEKYVLVHGYVTAEGRFQEIRIVRSILPETDKAILASLADWEFRAATKDGVPVRVEFLLSIPAKGL